MKISSQGLEAMGDRPTGFPVLVFLKPNPDQPEPRCGYTKHVENTSMGPGPRHVL
jgi:hypothetical protein